jgi:putative tryptophan/tyrosine transport system substrate-binding protein
MASYIGRRKFLATLGGAAVAWPVGVRAQQPAMPLVGYVRSGSRAASAPLEAAFRQGLRSMGFDEGRNVVIDYRYAEHQNDQLPTLIADLVRRQVELIYAADNPTAVAAKAANAAIPIVFRIGGDPAQLGLVASLNRPGGNITGVSFLSTATTAIRLQMLREAVPNAAVIGLIVDTANPSAEPDTREAQEAARKLGLELHVVSASNTHEIDAAIASIVQRHAHALVIGGDALFTNRRQQFAALAMRHALPAAATTRDFPEAGLLMSYGASNIDADRLGGIYVGRVLKGDKPADLPVQQSVKVELIINLIAAKAIGLEVPSTLLARADEVIE